MFLGALFALVLHAPAHWLANGVGLLSHGQVLLHDTRGTVWQGSAVLSLAPGSGQRDLGELRSLPERLDWRWGWAWPGLMLSLSNPCCTPATPMRWRVSAGLDGLHLKLDDHRSVWPVQVLAGLGAPWNTLQAEGQLQLQSTGFEILLASDALRWHGQATAQLHNLSSKLSTLRPMGSYELALQAGSEPGSTTPALHLHTLNGPLRLQGQSHWHGQRLGFKGEATADEGAEAALSNLLNIIGRRDGARSLFSLGPSA
jgi:general secretion pathway protein N